MKVFVDTSIFVDCLRSTPIASSKDFLEIIEGKKPKGYGMKTSFRENHRLQKTGWQRL